MEWCETNGFTFVFKDMLRPLPHPLTRTGIRARQKTLGYFSKEDKYEEDMKKVDFRTEEAAARSCTEHNE